MKSNTVTVKPLSAPFRENIFNLVSTFNVLCLKPFVCWFLVCLFFILPLKQVITSQNNFMTEMLCPYRRISKYHHIRYESVVAIQWPQSVTTSHIDEVRQNYMNTTSGSMIQNKSHYKTTLLKCLKMTLHSNMTWNSVKHFLYRQQTSSMSLTYKTGQRYYYQV